MRFTVTHGGDPQFFTNSPKAIIMINEINIPVSHDMYTLKYEVISVDSTSCEIEF